MMERRMLLGLAGLFVAAPKTASSAILNQAVSALDTLNDSRHGYPEACDRGPMTTTGMMDLMSVGEKAILSAHEACVAKAESEMNRRRYHRQFLHSMSPAAKRALTEMDRDKVREAEGPLYAMMEKMREAYDPHWKEERDYPRNVLAGSRGYR